MTPSLTLAIITLCHQLYCNIDDNYPQLSNSQLPHQLFRSARQFTANHTSATMMLRGERAEGETDRQKERQRETY
jgi:hypothetical protein